MTGPLAQQFAQVRRALEWMADYRMTGTEQTLHIDFQGKAREVLPALSVIERHVQDMETALHGTRERTLADGPCWCPDWLADDWREDDPLDERIHHTACLAARAALPAREKEEE